MTGARREGKDTSLLVTPTQAWPILAPCLTALILAALFYQSPLPKGSLDDLTPDPEPVPEPAPVEPPVEPAPEAPAE